MRSVMEALSSVSLGTALAEAREWGKVGARGLTYLLRVAGVGLIFYPTDLPNAHDS